MGLLLASLDNKMSCIITRWREAFVFLLSYQLASTFTHNTTHHSRPFPSLFLLLRADRLERARTRLDGAWCICLACRQQVRRERSRPGKRRQLLGGCGLSLFSYSRIGHGPISATMPCCG